MIDIMYKGADTALTTEILNGHNLKDGLITACPMGRLLTANDVTGPAIFLASDESSFITGHMLMVDGGFSVK
jgi:enoyl-[acyl-carrier-protein] reductase (NADH)